MPLINQIHTDKILSEVSVKYQNKSFVASELAPIVPVQKSSDQYRIYARNFRLPETIRAYGAEAKQHQFDVSFSTYQLEYHALKDFVSDRKAANYDIFDLRTDTVEELTDKILLRHEKMVSDLLLATSTSWSQNASLSTAQQWSLDTTTSNPIRMIDTATAVIVRNSGYDANCVLLPNAVMQAAKNHMSVLDRIKYTSADITPVMLAGLFDVEQILVPKTAIDTSQEGIADAVTDLWGSKAFVCYKAMSPSPLKPSALYTFKANLPMVKRWRVEERESECIEVGMEFQAKIVSSLSGYVLGNVIA